MQRITRSQSTQRNEAVLREELEEQRDAISFSILKALKAAETKANETFAKNKQAIQINKEAGCKRAPNCTFKISQTAVYEFKQLGFEQFLERAALRDSTKEAIINMFAQFITFVKTTYRQHIQNMNTKQILLWVMDTHRCAFQEYSDALSSKASNKKSRIEAIMHAVSFLDVSHFGTEVHAFADAIRGLQRLQKQHSQADRAEYLTPVKGVQHLISINAYPRGGLADIRRYLDEGWEYFDAIVAATQAGFELKEDKYLECLRYVLATLWGYDNNARGLAIERVCVNDVTLALEHHDFVLSQHFKTYGHYEYQAVRFSQIITKVWNPIIRPHAARKTNCERVFLSYSGKPLSDSDASRHVQKWFRRYGLVINVTTLRKVLEASYTEAEAAEVITSEAHASLTKAQGHTAETADRYYDIVGKEDALSIVSALENTSHFQSVCDSLAPHLDGAADLPSRVDAILTRQSSYDGLLAPTFGSSYTGVANATNTRFSWTTEELEWLKCWQITHPPDTTPNNRYSACLQDLREAPAYVRGHFHPHHVANSDRLKTGAQRVERELAGLNR